jgi:Mg2+ and Co2+ transporter CorA
MDVRARRIHPDKRSEVSSFEEFLRHREESEGFFWIDVTAPPSAELTELLYPLACHPLILERCVAIPPHPASSTSRTGC